MLYVGVDNKLFSKDEYRVDGILRFQIDGVYLVKRFFGLHTIICAQKCEGVVVGGVLGKNLVE